MLIIRIPVRSGDKITGIEISVIRDKITGIEGAKDKARFRLGISSNSKLEIMRTRPI